MNASTDAPQLPNPMTPMAFLPPELAFQSTISVYIAVGSAAVLIWDVLNNLRGDLPVLFHYPLKIPSLVYLFSRIAILAFILTTVVYWTAPVAICYRISKAVDSLFAVTISSTSLLFLIRVLAIFHQNKIVKAFFCAMWLAVVAGVLTAITGLTGDNIGPTKYCMNVTVESYVGAAGIIPLVNDTLVFLAISWRLMKNTHTTANGLRWDVRVFFRGDYLPAFSRGLLQDGQVYYLTTITTNLLTIVVFYFQFVPVVYRAMFAVPNAVLMNIMACRVYRRTKNARYQSSQSSSTNLRSVLKMNDNLIPLSFTSKRDAHSNGGPEGGIEVLKTVKQCDDRLEDHKAKQFVNGNDNSMVV
ncbi:hypothetical protein NLJ89_g7506 [Agrocybe chaxingu]|uniref:Uncharacterized protein n=1 Tax=Agrocybe chaxingu TaxID=84603 RepID=A0A9W8MTM3_9AGAR|nr:hypothetical protein NLJ89_g7506 [Agrocybe chaxingu]